MSGCISNTELFTYTRIPYPEKMRHFDRRAKDEEQACT